ncbi:MAG: hypothetical protein MUP21_13985 [Dehalococcoidia bacterium]|nr:hypothetical protein [Dehalococcoidia bacterium]
MPNSVSFNFYGLGIELRSSDGNTVEAIRRDFAYFEAASETPRVTIDVFDEKPDYASLPGLTASIYTLNYVCYTGKDLTYTDYHGRGLRTFDRRSGNYQIFSEDRDLRHEIGYLTMLSAAGQFLDSRHIHRVHALGISVNGKAVLILLPEKGGKTTLALRLLSSEHVKLLSEDSPLITSRGDILPFPLRLGILPGGESGIPAEYLYPMNFMRVGTKYLVDVSYYTHKIGTVCPPGAILLGERSLGCDARIEPAGRLSAGRELIKNSVVGLGLHQGLEYLLGRNIWETAGKTRLAFSRLNNSIRVLRHSKSYRYVIGHDIEKNQQVLLDFLAGLDL